METALARVMRAVEAETSAPALLRVCAVCEEDKPVDSFSRNQLARPLAKCKSCVATALLQEREEHERSRKLKRCVQCFQDLPDDQFSKRQYVQLDGKCKSCVAQLEREAAKVSSALVGKWSYDQHYRCCHRGKTGGVGVRTKSNIASPLLGTIPLGRVFKATHAIYNEQGDPMVKLESLSTVLVSSPPSRKDDKADESKAAAVKPRDGWVPCRSIRNELFIEPHSGPWVTTDDSAKVSRYFRCVIEGCKVRTSPDLELVEIGYVLYGDVVQVVECQVATDGVVFLRLHDRYFDGPAWVVERTLDNESVLNEIDGPSTEHQQYRCVQESGAPTRQEPSLAAPPVGRIPCGRVVTVVQRVVTPERHVFLQLVAAETHPKASEPSSSSSSLWVIETSTVCASVMVRLDKQSPF